MNRVSHGPPRRTKQLRHKRTKVFNSRFLAIWNQRPITFPNFVTLPIFTGYPFRVQQRIFSMCSRWEVKTNP